MIKSNINELTSFYPNEDLKKLSNAIKGISESKKKKSIKKKRIKFSFTHR